MVGLGLGSAVPYPGITVIQTLPRYHSGRTGSDSDVLFVLLRSHSVRTGLDSAVPYPGITVVGLDWVAQYFYLTQVSQW